MNMALTIIEAIIQSQGMQVKPDALLSIVKMGASPDHRQN